MLMQTIVSLFLSFSPTNTVFHNVRINSHAMYDDRPLVLTGYGLATKKAGVSTVKIAVNQFFCEVPERFVRTTNGAVGSLPLLGDMAMSVTFLRNVGSDQVQSEIETIISDNLSDQEYQYYESDIQKVLQAIARENSLRAGETLNLVGEARTGRILYQNGKGSVSVIRPDNPKFIYKVFSGWFGNTSSGSSASLKTQLLQKPQYE